MTGPVVKKFNSEKFSNDVYAHRVALKLSRLAYAEHLGLGNCEALQSIETNKKVQVRNVALFYNICQWMGRDLSEYFV